MPANTSRRLPRPRPPRPRLDSLLWKLYFVPARILRFFRVTIAQIVVPQRIGHLTIEPDCYLKELILDGVRDRPVLLLPRAEVANQAMVDLWRRYFTVVQNPLLVALLFPLTLHRVLRRPLNAYTAVIEGTATSYAVFARWGERPPLLQLPGSMRDAGRAMLKRWGLPADAWFVCVHSREGGYSPEDEHWHTYRNSPITDYVPAMQAIVAAGGWCVRLGDPTMAPLPPMQGVIDYALSSDKTDAMDLFLIAECRFFLGNTSGLYMVAAAFGRPCALANAVPVSISYGTGIHDIAIPKRLRRDGALIPISELMPTPAAHYRYTRLYEADCLEVVSNTPQEIRELAEEMMEQLDGRATYTADDEARQAAYRALFVEGSHYSYGAVSRIGREFLRNLDDPMFR